MRKNRPQEANPSSESRERVILEGVVRELSVIQTEEGDFIGFPLLGIKHVPQGARIKVIVYEPVPQNP